MKKYLKAIGSFFKENGHKIFTFTVGLAFLIAVCLCVGLLAARVYRVFVPAGIYTDDSFAKTLYGGSVYEAYTGEEYKPGSAEYFENYIENFIKQDMPDFDEPVQISDEYMISYGIWQAITLNNMQGAYKYDKKGSFRVPAGDAETFARYCFDYPEKIKHRSVDVCSSFSFNSLNKTYKVRAAGIQSFLIPDVIDVKEGENDTYIVTADCYEANMMSAEDPTNDPTNLRKRVKITLQDMGVQTYQASTGKPIYRYMFLSMSTEHNYIESTKNDIELN